MSAHFYGWRNGHLSIEPVEAAAPAARPYDLAAWLRATADKLGWNQMERDKLRQAADELDRLETERRTQETSE